MNDLREALLYGEWGEQALIARTERSRSVRSFDPPL